MAKRHAVEERKRFWAELNRSGESIRVVAKRIGVPAATAYVWRKAGPIPEPPVFAQVLPAQPTTAAALRLETGSVTIVVERGFDAELLRAVVGALGREP